LHIFVLQKCKISINKKRGIGESLKKVELHGESKISTQQALHCQYSKETLGSSMALGRGMQQLR
jgi:hypothetical protein